MNKEDSFYIKELQPIRGFCLHSDKEDVYKYIYSLQQENQQLKQKVNQLETNIDEAIRYIKAYMPSFQNYIASDTEFNAKEILSILERGK